MSKRKLYSYFFILLYWIITINFSSAFSIMIVKGFMHLTGIQAEALTNQIAIYWISPGQYIKGLLSGVFLGILFIMINELSDRFHWERLGFGQLIMIKSLIYVMGFVLIFFVIYLIVDTLGYYPEDLFVSFKFSQEITLIFLMVMLLIVLLIVLLNYVIETNRKIGDFNVISFITGKYRDPVIENRLFMFLDLKSSTSIAEKLDDLRYSELIRDCFRDFNYAIKPYELLDIYQYVGDEVVVTTKWENKQSLLYMIDLYFKFDEKLTKRSDQYEANYGVRPFFKAGIHGGKVSVTEIGTLKREIAFHGDVLNTTSRIQSLCNELNQGLLVSLNVLNRYDKLGKYEETSMGSFHLKGKEEAIEIVAIAQ